MVRHVGALLEQHVASLGEGAGEAALLGLCGGGGGDEGVEGGGGQHLGFGVGDVQRHEGRAVKFVQVEALDFVVVVDADFVSLGTRLVVVGRWGVGRWRAACLEVLGCVVARVDRVLVLARVRVHLAAVDFDGVQLQRTVGGFCELAVLPLDDAFWAFGVRCWGGLAARLEVVLVAFCIPKNDGVERADAIGSGMTYDSRQRGSKIPQRSRRRRRSS